MPNTKDLIREIESKYNLKYNNEKSEFLGNLFVDENDCYDISINTIGFPNSFPIVKELGNRIPHKIDRHKYDDSSCCLTTKAKEQVLLKKNIKTLDRFISDIVIPFFQNNSYFEINKEYIFGAYSHGIIGVFEAYKEITNISNPELLVKILTDRINEKKYGRNEFCFCKSGIKFKKCHLNNYQDLHLIDKIVIIDDIKKLIKKINK